MLCVIQPDSIAVIIRIALNQIEKAPYPAAPKRCLKTGMEIPEIKAGKMTLIR